jgi:hypothetical protein
MKVQRTPPTKPREMGYRFSEKSSGWFKVSQEFLRLEAEALAAFHQRYEEYKLNQWLYFEANPDRVNNGDWRGKTLDEVLAVIKDRPLCPDIEFDLDPADYQENTP